MAAFNLLLAGISHHFIVRNELRRAVADGFHATLDLGLPGRRDRDVVTFIHALDVGA